MVRPRPMLFVMEAALRLLERGRDAGEAGERAAYFFVRRQGYTVVARRWRHRFLDGEVDLVAWEGEVLCVVEVKTRGARGAFAGEMSVDAEKQRALRRMANAYVAELPWTHRRGEVAVRFDVVSVYLGADGKSDVRLLRDAFR